MPSFRPVLIFLLWPCCAFVFLGCFRPIPQHAYYVSPLNGNQSAYQPLPLAEDSAHTAFFASGSFSLARANEDGRDNLANGRISLSAAHHTGHFQFFYGL